MKIRFLFILLLLLTTAGIVNAYDTWLNTFDCPGFCYDLFVLPPEGGGTVFACYSYLTKDDLTTWLVKADNTGDIIWQHSYDLPPRGLAQVPGGGSVLLIGYSTDYKLIRFDTSGNTVWSIDLPVSAAALHITDDGYILLRYGSEIQKRDLDGGIIWTLPEPPQMDAVTCINEAPSMPGGFTVAGEEDGWFQLGIADSNGVVPWTGEFHDPYYGYESTNGAYSDSEGNCFGCVTYSTSYPPPDAVGWVLRVDEGGTLNWSKEFNQTGGICPSPEGNVVVAGNDVGAEFFIRFLTPESGATTSLILHGIPGVAMYPQDMVPCSDGGYLVGGYAEADVFIARIDSLGLINGTGIEDSDVLHPEITVSPNPASLFTEINVTLPVAYEGTAVVYDLRGRKITAIVIPPGENALNWDLRDSGGRDVPSGLYCVVVTAYDATAIGRVMVLR